MMLKKSLLTLALSCGLMALPSFAQSSPSSTPDQQTPSAQSTTTPDQQTPATTPSGSATDQQTPAAQSGAISDQSSTASQSGMNASGDSSSIQSNVQSALQKDDQLSGQSVNATVSGKKVMLSGTVSSQAQKDHAEQVAMQTAGSGYTVKNHIKVSGSAGSGAMGSGSSTTPPQK
jgi:microcompartment protein CcmK/EutM